MGFAYIDNHVLDYFRYTAVPDAFFDAENHPEFSHLSLEAIMLYSKMYRRAMMSRENGWIDEKGHVYIIYSVNEVCRDLRCASQKAVKILKELQTPVNKSDDTFLIVKKRMGLQMPDRIYVMDFTQYTPGKAEQVIPENIPPAPEFRKSQFKNSENHNSGMMKTTNPEFRKSKPNYQEDSKTNTDNNNTGNISTGSYNSQSVSQSLREQTDKQTDHSPSISKSEAAHLIETVKKNISYDFVENQLFGDSDSTFNFAGISVSDWELYQSLFQIICDTLLSRHDMIYVGKAQMPYEQVKERLLKIKQTHMIYVIRKFTEESQKKEISNPRAYLLRCLFNAPADCVAASY